MSPDQEKIIELVIPDLGETGEVELVSWNFKEGESFSEGDEICDLITDKAAFSLEAPSEGILKEIRVLPKSKVTPGSVVGLVAVKA